jgi:ribosomal protein L40E
MLGRLRARALMIMEQLDRVPATPAPAAKPAKAASGARAAVCGRCQTRNEPDAKFCKQCGDRLGSVHA